MILEPEYARPLGSKVGQPSLSVDSSWNKVRSYIIPEYNKDREGSEWLMSNPNIPHIKHVHSDLMTDIRKRNLSDAGDDWRFKDYYRRRERSEKCIYNGRPSDIPALDLQNNTETKESWCSIS